MLSKPCEGGAKIEKEEIKTKKPNQVPIRTSNGQNENAKFWW